MVKEYTDKYYEVYRQLKNIMSEEEFNKTLSIIIDHKLLRSLNN